MGKAFVNVQICRASASTVLSVVYDLPMVTSTDDPTVVRVNMFLDAIRDYGQLGNYLVEFFTWMKYIPSSVASWKKLAEERYKEYSHMFVGMLREVGGRIVMVFICFSLPHRSTIMQKQGDERPSFAGTLVREKGRHRLSEAEAAWTAATM